MQLPRSQRQCQLWANGQGVSESVTWHFPDESGDEILWRVNIADIPGDCDFSELVGVDRQFMLLDDVRLTLELDHVRSVRPLEPIEFAGEMAPVCRASGAARALNLLLRRGRAVGNLELVEVTRPIDFPLPQAGCIVVVKIDGNPTWPGAAADLQSGDAVRQDRPMFGGPKRFQLAGIGRVAVMSIGTLPPRDPEND